MNNHNTEFDCIRLLTERFFNGETSLEEENRLYAFFEQHRSGLPEDIETNREMLLGFGAIGFGNATSKDIVSERTMPKKAATRRSIRKHLWLASGIAASILLCIGITFAFHQSERQDLARNYEGSYVIVNGQRIDDLSRIKPDIERALSQASHIEQRLAEKPAIKSAEQNVLNNIDDPDEKAHIEALLNE